MITVDTTKEQIDKLVNRSLRYPRIRRYVTPTYRGVYIEIDNEVLVDIREIKSQREEK